MPIGVLGARSRAMPTNPPALWSTATPVSTRRFANARSDADVRAPAIHGCVNVSDASYAGLMKGSLSNVGVAGITWWKNPRPFGCAARIFPPDPYSHNPRPALHPGG